MLLAETEGMAGRIGVHDPDAAWLLDRAGEHDRTKLGSPEPRGAEVSHGQVEMKLLRRAAWPFRGE
jgi:hypothetical protein